MAEADLTLSVEDLRDAIAEFVYGGDGDYSGGGFTTAEKAVIDRIRKGAMRLVYHPPPITGRHHEWSFLSPIASLSLNAQQSSSTVTIVSGVVTIAAGTWPSWAADGMLEVAGKDYSVNTRDSDTQITLDDTSVAAAAGTAYRLHQDDYTLPDDFSRLLDDFTFTQADNAWYTIKLVGEARIRELRQRSFNANFSSSDPQFCAIRPLKNDVTVGTRKEVMFWPQVIDGATLSYRYRVRPDAGTSGYVYGASDHSDMILYACLAEAELYLDHARGPMYERFSEALAASVMADSQDNKPRLLGYNGDASDGMNMVGLGRSYLYSGGVTYTDLGVIK